MDLYSQQPHPVASRYHYSVHEKVRLRIIRVFEQHENAPGVSKGHYSFGMLLQQVSELAEAKYGHLTVPYYEATRISDNPVIQHFFSSNDQQALEFIEMCFVARTMGLGDGPRDAVQRINRIFEEERVGYELTMPAIRETGKRAKPIKLLGGFLRGTPVTVDYPKIVRKGERTVHELAVQPALEALRDPRLSVANAELLDAFAAVQKGNYADAITSCGSAFESVLKTICDEKRWAYDANKDTCARLVEICRDNGLFPPLYFEGLKFVGTVRNKLGDAHGKGPTPAHVAGREHAEHMIAMTCAHIDFLVRLAGF